MNDVEKRFDNLYLEIVDKDKASLVQEIYFNSPIYFRRVDGTEPMDGMAIKDIKDVPPKHGVHYVKIAALIYNGLNPIGYADLHVNYRCLGMVYLGLLILREDFQGKGLGRKSYELIEKYLLDHFDIEKIYLGVSNHNLVQDYWEKMGFIPNGFTYTWKGEHKESVVTELEKQLKPAKLRLEQPSQALYESFLEFVENMRSHNQPLWDPYLPKKDETPEQFVNRLRQRETNPEKPFVPETVYWAIYDGHVVGRISLRHRLEGNLLKNGGNIGYEVGPKWRNRGFAKEMLRLVLKTPKAKELGKVLLTCSPSNEASNKTIIRNNGIFDKKTFVDFINDERNHYWITTEK